MARTGVTVLGLGSDLVEIERFRQVLARRPRIVDRIFSEGESGYVACLRDPVPHLAARFGAKEAVMKALGVGLWKFALRDVEVMRHTDGKPELLLHGRALAIAKEVGVTGWLVSLSHTDTTAMAVVLAIGIDSQVEHGGAER